MNPKVGIERRKRKMTKGKQHTVNLNNDFHKFEVGQEVAFGPLGGFLCRVDKIIPLNDKGQCKIIVTRLDDEEEKSKEEAPEEEKEKEVVEEPTEETGEEEEKDDDETEDSDS